MKHGRLAISLAAPALVARERVALARRGVEAPFEAFAHARLGRAA